MTPEVAVGSEVAVGWVSGTGIFSPAYRCGSARAIEFAGVEVELIDGVKEPVSIISDAAYRRNVTALRMQRRHAWPHTTDEAVQLDWS